MMHTCILIFIFFVLKCKVMGRLLPPALFATWSFSNIYYYIYSPIMPRTPSDGWEYVFGYCQEKTKTCTRNFLDNKWILTISESVMLCNGICYVVLNIKEGGNIANTGVIWNFHSLNQFFSIEKVVPWMDTNYTDTKCIFFVEWGGTTFYFPF